MFISLHMGQQADKCFYLKVFPRDEELAGGGGGGGPTLH